MVKKNIEAQEKEAPKEPAVPAPRYAVYFIDQVTQVQIGAATEDLDKFTKTDLMKMVKAFKEEVNIQNAKWEKPVKPRKRGNRKVSKRVRSTPKVREPEVEQEPESHE